LKTQRQSKTALQRGFTLVEIMIVIAIIGLISSIVAVNVLRSQGKAKTKKAETDCKVIKGAITMFNAEESRFPESLDELVPEFIESMDMLKDPWNREYLYEFGGGSGDLPFRLGSYGADGAPGGEKENEDVFPFESM
jgi:general secretion pathway protein G